MKYCLPLYVTICACLYALNKVGLSFSLLGLHVMAHLARLRFICAHSTNFWSLLYLGFGLFMSSVSMSKSSTYAVVVHVLLDVLKR